jgi:hypothetical protein
MVIVFEIFVLQILGTVIAAVVTLTTAWWQILTIAYICQPELLPPNSPWTCPGDRVFYDASVIWGLIGPKRMFGALGLYKAINWFFLIGLLAPVPVWLLTKVFPKQKWLFYINMCCQQLWMRGLRLWVLLSTFASNMKTRLSIGGV